MHCVCVGHLARERIGSETAAECGMSSNVYTDRVPIADRLKGKPSDVDARLRPTAEDRQMTVDCAHMAEFTDIQ